MGDIIHSFEEPDFPARTEQPYYYNEDGALKTVWWKKIISVGDHDKHGSHKQVGYNLILEDGLGPTHLVYGPNDALKPKTGDYLVFTLNESVSEFAKYPSYTVGLGKQSFREKVWRYKEKVLKWLRVK
tara:strand:- start:19 stop:402 length:384 start_codon:yes stop_codon:yes gene_type:complete